MAVQNDNTILNKGDLKAYHQKILPFLGGNYMMQTGVSDYYSTDEKVVGVWTDGRPVYQISISGNLANSSGQGNSGDAFVPLPAGTNSDLQIGFQGYVYNKTSSGSIGISPCHTYVNGIGHISGNLIPSWATAHSDTVLIRNSMPSFNGWPFIATVQYTKTTDAAGSATTTPGAYDLNRPDLWPTNQEIFFGNGLYGKRYTGTYTGQNATFEVYLDTTLKKGDISSIINMGGSINRANGGATQTLNWSNSATMHMLGVGTTGVYLQIKENNTYAGHKYDVWMTYTK